MPEGVVHPDFGDPSASAPAWSDVEQLLANAQLSWLVTVRADGRPHATPLVGLWHEGCFSFCTGEGAQKHRNLVGEPRAAVTTGSTGADGWDTGTDVVVEGVVRRVTDEPHLQALARAWTAKYGEDWAYEVRGQELVEAGEPVGGALAFVLEPDKVIAFGGGHGQTTYRF